MLSIWGRATIPQYLVLTNWLNGIKKEEKFLWNEEIERDFIELKKGVVSSAGQEGEVPWILGKKV